MSEVTRLLDAMDRGEPTAAEELLPLVYEELRRFARQKMAAQSPGQTIQATALVHEAYLKLAGAESRRWHGRRHFYAAAAEVVKLRFFAGLSEPEVAKVLESSERTVQRQWAHARALLFDRIQSLKDE